MDENERNIDEEIAVLEKELGKTQKETQEAVDNIEVEDAIPTRKENKITATWNRWQKDPKARKILFAVLGLLLGLVITGLCVFCFALGMERGQEMAMEPFSFTIDVPTEGDSYLEDVSGTAAEISGQAVSGGAVSGDGVTVSGTAANGTEGNLRDTGSQNQSGGLNSNKGSGNSSGKGSSGNNTGSNKNNTGSDSSATGNSSVTATATAGYAGKLSVSGNKLMANGSPIQLRGVSTHGLSWFPQYVNKELFGELKSWGANTVRLAMYTAEYNGYCTGDEANRTKLKELVKKGVQYATEQNMYVIIDWHILSDGNPNTYKSEAIAFFSEMAKTYKDNNHVIYEICNEPNGGTSWSEIKKYAKEVIPAIRQHDPDGVILVGTPTWSQEVDKAAADPITGYDNIMYTLHFYANTHRESLRNTLTTAVNAGLPVFVSEFSICDASGNGGINTEQANLWIQTLNKYGVSYVSWSLCNKAETSALIQSSCSKTSGITESELSECGKWLLQTLQGKISSQTVTNQSSSTNSQNQSAKKPENYTPQCSSGVQATVANSWQEGNALCIQYDVKVVNSGNSAKTDWKGTLTFPANATVNSGWNANFTASGKTVTLTPMDYNKTIAAGSSLEGLGVIIKFE